MNVVIFHTLTDQQHPALANYRDLTDVALRSAKEPEWGIYIAESLKVLERALRAGHAPISVLTTPQWCDALLALSEKFPERSHALPVYVCDEALVESITGFHVHRGTLAAMARPSLPSMESVISQAKRVVVLENIVDHTNMGAVFRSVAGLGCDAVIVSPSCADPLYRRSIRVSMGTVMQVPWTRASSWTELVEVLHSAHFHLAALALDDTAIALDVFAAKPPDKLALILGTEGAGLSKTALESADSLVSIPMSGGVDSLNVAAASAVAMWALR